MLQALRDGIADVVFLDPPFNLGKKYATNGGSADRLREDDYFDYMKKVLHRSVAILRPGGALYLYHIPQWAIRFSYLLLEYGLSFRHWIAISMKNGFVRGNGLYPAHYSLLYFTLGVPSTFHRPKIVPQTCRHCNNYIKDYGGYKRYVKDGLNLSDVWDDVSPVRHAKYKHRESNELPPAIPNRVVSMSGCPDGLFVDPFAGAGTTLVAAREEGMKFIASDREPEHVELIRRRLTELGECEYEGAI